MKVAAIIPARMASTRLPGKPMLDICGKPMVWRVYERASMARGIDEVWVATDDQGVVDAVERLGGKALMTSQDCASGTDRIAEAAEKIIADIYVNVQGDEPMIPPALIEQTIAPMLEDPSIDVATAATPIGVAEEIFDPSKVKTVLDENGFAMYFSRAPIPYHRDEWKQRTFAGGKCLKHIGIYAYRRDFLFKFTKLPQTGLERVEKLEQLRALGHGYKIKVSVTELNSLGVDTPKDLDVMRQIFSEEQKA